MREAEKQLNNWIKECGFTEKMLFNESVELLRAKRLATNLIKESGRQLTEKEVFVVQQFLKNVGNSKKRASISKKTCYQIMNIGKRINRQQFKQRRKIKQSFR